MCNDADQWVMVADRIVPTGTSLSPFVRFGSKAEVTPSGFDVSFTPESEHFCFGRDGDFDGALLLFELDAES